MLIPRKALELHNAASKDDPRFQIKGILIDRTRCIATDGRILVIAEYPAPDVNEYPTVPKAGPPLELYSPDWKPRILPADTCKAALKAMPKSTRYGINVLQNLAVNEVKSAANGEIYCGVTDLETITRFAPQSDPDILFPAWEKVIPDPATIGAKVGFTIDVLQKLLLTLEKTGCKAVTFGFHCDAPAERAVAVKGHGSDLAVSGVIMPALTEDCK